MLSEESVNPSSMMMNSKSARVCASTLSAAAATNSSALKTGIKTEIDGLTTADPETGSCPLPAPLNPSFISLKPAPDLPIRVKLPQGVIAPRYVLGPYHLPQQNVSAPYGPAPEGG